MKMIPLLLNEMVPERKKSSQQFRISRPKSVPKNEDPGDCGVYALKYIECKTVGCGVEGLSDQCIPAMYIKLAAEIYYEEPTLERKERKERSCLGFGARPARERPCRRRYLCLSFVVFPLRSSSPTCQRLPCPSSGFDFTAYGGFGLGVETFVDPPPPALVPGKGVFFRFAFAGFVVGKSWVGSLRMRSWLKTRFSGEVMILKERKRWLLESRVLGLKYAKGGGDLEACLVSSSDEQGARGCLFRWRKGGGDQVEAVTTCDASMEQITPLVEPPP
ncbi:hypothetical protein HID58_033427 [Brassica napus]|uniref:Ubiquitin-like protease family profile domain-containing protein n=1 Tax=Brassica napus TaxID=3708 RepID=A0ABQ8BZ80_BRANA|nr:hypothetical protein HID58_033427 [Brassica napus]